MSGKTCKTCEWWIRCEADQSLGTCAAFPEWRPMIKATHWCGQWQAKKRYPMISCCMGIRIFLIAIVVIAAISAMLFGCETTGPAYDPETTCSVDSAKAEIICRDKP